MFVFLGERRVAYHGDSSAYPDALAVRNFVDHHGIIASCRQNGFRSQRDPLKRRYVIVNAFLDGLNAVIVIKQKRRNDSEKKITA